MDRYHTGQGPKTTFISCAGLLSTWIIWATVVRYVLVKTAIYMALMGYCACCIIVLKCWVLSPHKTSLSNILPCKLFILWNYKYINISFDFKEIISFKSNIKLFYLWHRVYICFNNSKKLLFCSIKKIFTNNLSILFAPHTIHAWVSAQTRGLTRSLIDRHYVCQAHWGSMRVHNTAPVAWV